MARNKGICAICGKGGKLSLEHVPPQCADNDKYVEINTVADWERAGQKWEEMKGARPLPEGIGYATICEECNRHSGTHYVPHFCRTVNAGFSILRQFPVADFDNDVELKVAEFRIKAMRPLPFVKETIAMLLAMNGEVDPEFRTDNPHLVNFVRDKDALGLPDQYHLYLSLFFGPARRFAPVMSAIIERQKLVLTAIDYPPYSYVLTIGRSAEHVPVGDVTVLAKCKYKEERDLDFRLVCGFGHTPFPLDYRSSARLKADEEAGKKNTTISVRAVKSDGTIVS